jgi:general stress protein 26
MKNEAPNRGDLHKLADLIEDIEIAMMTTRSADGALSSRPLQTLKLDADGELVFFTAADSIKIEELTNDSRVNLTYVHAKDQRYISVRGKARMDRDRATIDELWTLKQTVFFPQGKSDPNLMVLRVRIQDAAYWEAKGNFLARALDFARGMLDPSPSDLGDHGHLEI